MSKFIVSHRGITPTVEVKLKDGTTVIMNVEDANETAIDAEVDTETFAVETTTPTVDGFDISYNHKKITPGSTVTLNFGLVNPSGEVEFEFQPIVGSAFVQGVDGAFSIKRNGSKSKVQDIDRTFQVRGDATADDDCSITIVPHNDAARAVASQLSEQDAKFEFEFVEKDDELLDATESEGSTEAPKARKAHAKKAKAGNK